MEFLVLLLTIGAYKVLGWHFDSKHDRWFFLFGDKLTASLIRVPRLAMLVTLLLPLLLLGLLLNLSNDWLFGFWGVFCQVLILFYALGRESLFERLEEYIQHWNNGDYQSAFHHAEKQLRGELGFDAADTASLHANSCKGLLYQWFEQVFVIVFWYLLAGPLAALFMRLLSLYVQRYKNQKTDNGLQLLHFLEWLPVRLLALTYAIAGNFSHSFKELMAILVEFKMPTNELLFKTGLAAAGLSETEIVAGSRQQQVEQLKLLERLQVRSLVVCMLLVALVTII